MRSFHSKSIILGIGIGIVITSLISMIYLAGINPATKMTKDEIIKQAKEYGLVENTEIFKSQTPLVQNEPVDKNAKVTNPVEATVPSVETNQQKEKPVAPVQKEEPVVPVQKEVIIAINSGDTSGEVAQKLFDTGLIVDKAAFINQLSSLGLSSQINIGEFKIKQGSDTRSIIKSLTGR